MPHLHQKRTVSRHPWTSYPSYKQVCADGQGTEGDAVVPLRRSDPESKIVCINMYHCCCTIRVRIFYSKIVDKFQRF